MVLLRVSLGIQCPVGVLFIMIKCDIIDYFLGETLFKVSFIKFLNFYFLKGIKAFRVQKHLDDFMNKNAGLWMAGLTSFQCNVCKRLWKYILKFFPEEVFFSKSIAICVSVHTMHKYIHLWTHSHIEGHKITVFPNFWQCKYGAIWSNSLFG